MAGVINRSDVSRHTESTSFPTAPFFLMAIQCEMRPTTTSGRKDRSEGPTKCMTKAEIQSLGGKLYETKHCTQCVANTCAVNQISINYYFVMFHLLSFHEIFCLAIELYCSSHFQRKPSSATTSAWRSWALAIHVMKVICSLKSSE